MAHLITTLGPKRADELGMILPHEHVFVDLRTWDQPGYGQAEADAVVALMGPQIVAARAAGVTAIVECTPVGVGRRADLLQSVSRSTGFPLVACTGVYREPWIPPWVHAASEEALCAWMQNELEGQIEHSGVQAGFVKVSAGDEGLTATETKVLRAAARSASSRRAAIGSHTIRGRVVREQLDIIEACGYTPTRFIWIHAHAEPDMALNLEMARRGAWIEYDAIGNAGSDPDFIARILRVLDAGLGDRLLLSHDRGWYDPAQPGGGVPRPFTDLSLRFLPLLRAAAVDEATLHLRFGHNWARGDGVQ